MGVMRQSLVTPSSIRLPDFLDSSCIALDLRAVTREEAVAELCERIKAAGKLEDAGVAVAAVLHREAEASTGIGHGVAVPHGRIPGFEQAVVAIGISRAGIDFRAEDGLPVRILALTLAPEHAQGAYLKLLAQIVHLMREDSFRSGLLSCTVPAEVLALVDASFDAILRH